MTGREDLEMELFLSVWDSWCVLSLSEPTGPAADIVCWGSSSKHTKTTLPLHCWLLLSLTDRARVPLNFGAPTALELAVPVTDVAGLIHAVALEVQHQLALCSHCEAGSGPSCHRPPQRNLPWGLCVRSRGCCLSHRKWEQGIQTTFEECV